MKKIKIVIDSNIFISGIFWKGSSYKVLNLWKEEVIINYTSLSIINEIIDTLRSFKIQMPEEDIYAFSCLLAENSVIVREDILLNYPVRDVKDNKFINCALLGEVKYIITFDKDLLVLKNIGNIKIIKPNILLKILSDK